MVLLINGWTENVSMNDRRDMHREPMFPQTVLTVISLISKIRVSGLITPVMTDGGHTIPFLS